LLDIPAVCKQLIPAVNKTIKVLICVFLFEDDTYFKQKLELHKIPLSYERGTYKKNHFPSWIACLQAFSPLHLVMFEMLWFDQ